MKTHNWLTTIVVCIIVPLMFHQCKPCWHPIEPTEVQNHFDKLEGRLKARICTDSKGNPIERDNMIIHFPASMTDAEIQAIIDQYNPAHIDSCLCDPRLQNWLWDVSTDINIEETVAQVTQQSRREGNGMSAYLNHFVYFMSPSNYVDGEDTTKFPEKGTSTAHGKVIAVLDTGLDPRYKARDLITLYQDQTGTCAPRGSFGWNFVDDNPDITDNNGHGTAVASIIAKSLKKAEDGGTYTCGASFLILKILDDNGVGNLFDGICAFQYAIAADAEVINASWGFYNVDNTYLRDSILSKTRPSGGHPVIVTSMGNLGKENVGDYRHFPSDYSLNMKYVVAVGGDIRSNIWESVSSRTASPAELMDFSNYRMDPLMITGPSSEVVVWALGFRHKRSNGTSYSAAFLSASSAITQCCHTGMRATEVRDSYSGITPAMVTTTTSSIDLVLMNAVLESGSLCRPPGS